MDRMTPPERSALMAKIRGKDTVPEMVVRRIVHGLGYRYRLHSSVLPGHPDLVFSARRKVIFVHGCWWHQHNCGRGSRLPKSRKGYWIPKLEANKKRDTSARIRLRRLGWKSLIVWECQTTNPDRVRDAARRFLER